MGTSINSYSVSLAMDAAGFINATKISRSEARQLTKEIESARDPLENYEVEHNRLEKQLQAGAISLGVYNRLLDAQRDKLADSSGVTRSVGIMDKYNVRLGELRQLYNRGAISAEDFHREVGTARWDAWSSGVARYGAAFTPLAIGIGAVTVATTASIAAGVAFVSHMKETQNQIDSVADSATKLGVTYNELTGIRFAAQEAGGVDAGTVDASIKKMQINISKAISDPDSDIAGAFRKLGVNAGQLMQAGPVESIKLLADGMEGVNSHADRLNLAMEIFGKNGTEMVSTLMGGRDAIGESVDFQNRWNGLTDAQVVSVQASNDAWDRIGVVIHGISTEMAAEFAPAFLVVADALLDAEAGVATLHDGMQLVVNTTAYYLGQLKDIAEVFIAMPAMMTGFGSATGAAFDFSSGQQAMEAVIAKREQLEQDAAKKIEERRLAFEAMSIEEGISKKETAEKDLIDKLSREINDAASDRIRKEEQKRLEMQHKLAQDALKSAEDHFKKQADNQKKLREDIAKGPQSIEAGSAEAAKFMADQANAAIAASVAPDQAAPTQEQMLAEAQKQTAIQEATKAKTDTMADTLIKILEKKPEVAKFR